MIPDDETQDDPNKTDAPAGDGVAESGGAPDPSQAGQASTEQSDQPASGDASSGEQTAPASAADPAANVSNEQAPPDANADADAGDTDALDAELADADEPEAAEADDAPEAPPLNPAASTSPNGTPSAELAASLGVTKEDIAPHVHDVLATVGTTKPDNPTPEHSIFTHYGVGRNDDSLGDLRDALNAKFSLDLLQSEIDNCELVKDVINIVIRKAVVRQRS